LLTNYINIKIHRTVILPFILCGFATWYRVSREEHRLRVLDIRAPRKILRPEREEVRLEWRKLYVEQLHVWYCSTFIIG
jgi:hypothetical protein